ncbi:MAG: putative anti-sigma regulatory factor, serine/threonine protein kinase [Candidatus Solibacter sp.]|nr:putative anti-sigma regulatory factor, serine/threonine protein kinase [Candidatus Solibacter sp.]
MKGHRALWHNQAILREAVFSLNGNLKELGRLAAEVSRFCRENALTEDAEFQLNLVLEELFVNTVRHGGCEGVENSARVRLRAVSDGVVVEFADRGRPFDPTTAPAADVNAPLAERPIGGLGIHLVREIMRDLRYERAGEWNQLRMRRPLAHIDTGEQPIS